MKIFSFTLTVCKKYVLKVAKQFEQQFGRSYSYRNVRRMMQFAEIFQEVEIVVTLSRQLSWSHFCRSAFT